MPSITARWNSLTGEAGVLRFVDHCLRGAGQVMFQDNPITGLLFLLGVFWGAYASGDLNVALGAVLGLVIATATAMLLRGDSDTLRMGLFGFNGVLVGCAVPTFLGGSPAMWAYLAIGAAVSTVATMAFATVMKSWGMPTLTFPFVLTTWFLMLGAYSFARVPIASLGPAALPVQVGASPPAFAAPGGFLLPALANGISQVFLIQNAVTAVIFVLALAVSSRWAAGFAIAGSAVAVLTATALGADTGTVGAGLMGFSPVLTAIALGTVFYQPTLRVTLYALLGVVFTVIVQGALDTAVTPLGIPTFTAPFVFATWLFLLPKRDFRPVAHEPTEGGVAAG